MQHFHQGMLAHYCDGHCILVEEETKNASNEKGGEKESDAIVLLAAVELLQNTIFVATKAKRDWKVMIECLRQSRKEWNQAFSIGIHVRKKQDKREKIILKRLQSHGTSKKRLRMTRFNKWNNF